MAATLDYYFSIVSPWAYIGHDALHDVVARNDVAVNYKPMALLEVFDTTGTPRLPDRHQTRKDYRMLELQRWREKRGLSFNLQPAHWPFPFQTADCMIIAAVEAGGDPAGFMRTVFKGIWEEQKNYAEDGELVAAADANGLSGAELLAAARSDANQAAYDGNTSGFLAIGGFGAPTYIVNGEIFWGQDRIDLLEDALKSGRGPFAATG
jgi:2-hydroxychromene-2-carboxylate isomerase